MPLEIKWERSTYWYGRYTRDGRKLAVRLDVLIEGTPPASRKLRDRGDDLFEKSRAKAELRLAQTIEELDSAATKEDLVKRIISIRRGGKMDTVLLKDMFISWAALPRKKKLSPRYLKQAESLMTEFGEFVAKHQRSARHMADVERSTAEQFMADADAQGFAPKTYNDKIVLLRSVFERLKEKASLLQNPFGSGVLKDDDPRGQEPFSVDELEAIIAVAGKPKHAFIRPILFACICTAMRRGDCCLLRWANVYLDEGFIRIKTAKKGKYANIPLFGLLESEIRKCLPATGEFVFPEAADQYKRNPDVITDRADRVLKEAGYFETAELLPCFPRDSAEVARGASRGNLRAEREQGLRKVRVHGMHSFRTTWITLALSRGVPIELVRRVTSHQSVEIVLDRYFKPGKEDFKRALKEKMPLFFLSPAEAAAVVTPTALLGRDDYIATALTSMTADNWATVRTEVLEYLKSGTSESHGKAVPTEPANKPPNSET